MPGLIRPFLVSVIRSKRRPVMVCAAKAEATDKIVGEAKEAAEKVGEAADKVKETAGKAAVKVEEFFDDDDSDGSMDAM